MFQHAMAQPARQMNADAANVEVASFLKW